MKYNKTDKGNYKIVFSWMGNAAVNIPIILSFIGFFYAAFIFFPGGCDSYYHDLIIADKKQVVKSILNTSIDKLRKEYVDLLPLKNSSSKKDEFLRVRNALQKSIDERYRLEHSNADTNLKYYASYAAIDRVAYYQKLITLKDSQFTIKTVIRDSPVFSFDTSTFQTMNITLKKEKNSFVQFVTKYPNFGFWYLLSIAQMVIWLMIVALMIGSLIKTSAIFSEYPYNLKNALLHLILPSITIVLFTLFFYKYLVNDHVINDSYFLNNFNSKMQWYSIPGYIVAIFCFSTYLFLSNKLELLDTIKTNGGVDAQQIKEDDYNQLKAAFDFSFLCSTIILSLFVFYLGVLFHATNDIEAMRFYSLLSGKPFIDYNYVYFVGLIHSLLLMIFYIPARMRINTLQVTKDERADADGNDGKKFFKVLWESLGSILMTLSPLLATFVEKLVNAVI